MIDLLTNMYWNPHHLQTFMKVPFQYLDSYSKHHRYIHNMLSLGYCFNTGVMCWRHHKQHNLNATVSTNLGMLPIIAVGELFVEIN